MESERFMELFKDSLREITAERFYANERGFQGQLNVELNKRLNDINLFPNKAIIEEEYQKTLPNHGINIRPDIIIHVPYEEGLYEDRREGNFVVIQLKLKASEKEAVEDFGKLDLMFTELNYPLGIFVNIDSDRTFYDKCVGKYKNRLNCLAVKLVDDIVEIVESIE